MGTTLEGVGEAGGEGAASASGSGELVEGTAFGILLSTSSVISLSSVGFTADRFFLPRGRWRLRVRCFIPAFARAGQFLSEARWGE